MEFYSEIDLAIGNQKEINHFKMITGRINRYFCQFLDLLDHPIESFNCCSNPEIVTLDGIVLSIETARIMRQNLNYPWMSGHSNKRYKFIEIISINLRSSTRLQRSLIKLNKEHVVLLESYTGKEGLTHQNFIALFLAYKENPCIKLLQCLCQENRSPYICPKPIRLFFRSIRKAVCSAISITPKWIWDNIQDYLRFGTGLEELVSLCVC